MLVAKSILDVLRSLFQPLLVGSVAQEWHELRAYKVMVVIEPRLFFRRKHCEVDGFHIDGAECQCFKRKELSELVTGK